ncbi:uncharacterized protein BXIN_0875 [Babesia sp. Xinjiang]|uniref:uncharacterized protein n=1 Tax=Babesia sp. Xinjiang TaxID=462227 RepID=UPI000A2357CB|nr:uncharacterized protein BXIN_0875 [Babesia sp. Xinjiang]ORM41257.1 hypothetical protein BXIN_0875 [Babesia sp. Xinjiang]
MRGPNYVMRVFMWECGIRIMAKSATRSAVCTFSRKHSTNRPMKVNPLKSVSDRVDRMIRKVLNASDGVKQDELTGIAKGVLRESLPLNEELRLLSKLGDIVILNKTFISDYVAKLEARINMASNSKKEADRSAADRNDSSYINIRTLQQISRFLISQNATSSVVCTFIENWIKNNSYYLVPDHMVSFNALLACLSHSGHHTQLVPEDFDVVGECCNDIKPEHLVDTLYLLGKVGIRNDALITSVGRVLHNEIAKGVLSPYHKTKLVRAYALLKHEHITFFTHIAEEVRILLEGRDTGKYLVVGPSTGKRYIEGIGSDEGYSASGVICKVLTYFNTAVEGSCEAADVEHVPFTGSNQQLYSDGQIIYILDSMLYLNLHHLEPYCRSLLSSAVKHCYSLSSIDTFDVEQLRSAITVLAQSKNTVDDSVLECISRRFIKAYVDGKATNGQLALFLKDLVKQTRKVVKTRNRRGRVCYAATFPGPRYLEKPLSEFEGVTGHAQPSMLESCCTAICENVYSFDLLDLTSCIRSVAYLGFRNENFYMAFVPYFKERIGSLTHVGIANLTQALTKVNVREEHLFYLMGRQHQLYLQGEDKAHKLYVKRIG